MALLTWLEPWEASPTVIALCSGALMLYGVGLVRAARAGAPENPWRIAAFVIGVVGIYAVLQTYYDYLSAHMFWIHRLQHLVLHHLGPFLIALAAPRLILTRGVGARFHDRVLHPVWQHPIVRGIYRSIQQPFVAAALFVGLIYFWLTPAIHFDAMLSLPLYNAMNWSMAIDGILFWWLMLAPPPGKTSGPAPAYGLRIILLWFVMLPQILLGAYISLSGRELYDVYAVCGRAYPLSPLEDQEIGGLITWIPSSMMTALAGIILLRRWMRERSRVETEALAAQGSNA